MNRTIPPTLRAQANGIELAYDSFGDPADPALLLIMGLGTQMIAWDEAFCEQLAERGLRVIRFDNRDIGQSTWLTAAGVPDVGKLLMQALAGQPVPAGSVPYTLADMAADTVGLLDALGVERGRTSSARRWAARSARKSRCATASGCTRWCRSCRPPANPGCRRRRPTRWRS